MRHVRDACVLPSLQHGGSHRFPLHEAAKVLALRDFVMPSKFPSQLTHNDELSRVLRSEFFFYSFSSFSSSDWVSAAAAEQMVWCAVSAPCFSVRCMRL